MKTFLYPSAALCLAMTMQTASAQLKVADFENLELADESHISISTEADDERTSFVSGDFEFATGCMSYYDYWYFFGYANQTDNTFATLDDQWKNIVGGGHNGSRNYGVSYCAAFNGPCYVYVLGGSPAVVPGFYITNSAYAYTSMMGGDSFAKTFADGDWFKLTITGYDADGASTGSKEFYLADLRDASAPYIVDDWRYCDLSVLGKVSKIGFELSSSDNGDYGMNTPAYFCFDDFGAPAPETVGVSEVPVANSGTSRSFDLGGRTVGAGSKGVCIVRSTDGSVRKVLKR